MHPASNRKMQGSRKITVSEAGRYTAMLRRCPDHEPVTKTFNVVSKDPDFVNDKKVCTVFGDPHVLTFDGKYNGATYSVLQIYSFVVITVIE